MQKVTECLILFEGSYCIFVPQGFVTKCFLIFIVDEVKNFAANNLFKLVSYVRDIFLCIWHILLQNTLYLYLGNSKQVQDDHYKWLN